jgi:HPt (histidine-containing phosphotransfer) domain-containing protein
VLSAEDPDDALQPFLASLAVSARAANLARCDVIAEGLQAVADDRLNEELRAAAARAAHQVVGSAGTFGSRAASELALELEEFFEGGADRRDLTPAWERLTELRRSLAGPHQVGE